PTEPGILARTFHEYGVTRFDISPRERRQLFGCFSMSSIYPRAQCVAQTVHVPSCSQYDIHPSLTQRAREARMHTTRRSPKEVYLPQHSDLLTAPPLGQFLHQLERGNH